VLHIQWRRGTCEDFREDSRWRFKRRTEKARNGAVGFGIGMAKRKGKKTRGTCASWYVVRGGMRGEGEMGF
jgi:hypothetical protein